VRLTGKIEDVGIGEILQIVSFSQKSGIFWLKGRKRSGTIVFKDGLLVRATADVVKHGVGDVLVKSGIIDSAKLRRAVELQKTGGFFYSIGTILARDFKVNAELVEEAARKLIEKTVYTFFHWREGIFVFEQKEFEESAEVIKADTLQYTLPAGMNSQFLAIEGARLRDEASRGEGGGEALEDKEIEIPVLDEGSSPEPVAAGSGAVESVPADIESAPAEMEPIESFDENEQMHYLSPGFLRDLERDGYIKWDENAEPVVEESKGLKLLKEVLGELSRPLSMSEIVLLLLRFSSEMMNRAVIFAVKSGHIVGLGQYGIELPDDNPDVRIRKMKIPLEDPSILRDSIENKDKVVKGLDKLPWNDYIVEQLGGRVPLEAFAAPVMVHDKVALILYGDNVPAPDKIGDTSSLEIFLSQMSISLERLVLERKHPGTAPPA
jgi:hypothetical protein